MRISQQLVVSRLTLCFRRVAALALLGLIFAAAPLAASEAELSVMTRNLYLGGDIARPLRARTPGEFFVAVAVTFAEVQATNFPERAVALAGEIEANRPDLIGLQEVTTWRSQFPADFSPIPNATVIEVDFLPILLAELASRNLAYTPVVIGGRVDVEVPGLTPMGLKDYRLTMRDVILVRDDAELVLANATEADFVVNAAIPTLAGPVIFTRGWGSVDVTTEGQTVRLINTHLESFAEAIRMAQVAELLSGPANTSLPVILLGDLNSIPGSPPFNQLTGAGFIDAGFEEGDERFTCCHASNLRNEQSTLSVRIDHVLYRGAVSSEDIKLIGHRAHKDRTVSGLWPSDHAGIIAKLILQYPAD